MWKWEAEGTAKAVIVMVHGSMEHHGRYKWLAQMWKSSGYHVVMGDLQVKELQPVLFEVILIPSMNT